MVLQQAKMMQETKNFNKKFYLILIDGKCNIALS